MAEFKIAKTRETEEQFRQFLGMIFNQVLSGGPARNGVLSPSHGLAVAQTATASGSVTVQSGEAVVQETILAGAVPLRSDTTKTLDILGANPMGGVPRYDIVVFDSATESIRNIVGTPNAVPTDPTVPGSAVALARLRHAASATTVPSSVIDDLRVFTTMRGGILNAPNAAALPTGHVGSAVYRWDLNTLQIANTAGSWRSFATVSDAKAGKRSHWGNYSGTTGADGYLTVTHGAGFTPSVVVPCATSTTFASGMAEVVLTVDNLTATSFRIRAVKPNSGTSSFAISFGAFLGE